MRTKAVLAIIFLSGCISQKETRRLTEDICFYFERNATHGWGITVKRDGRTVAFNEHPINIEIADGRETKQLESSYISFSEDKDRHVFIAKGKIKYKKVVFEVEDRWRIGPIGLFTVNRNLTVSGDLEGGFMSAVQLTPDISTKRDSVFLFAPGMIYGTTSHLPEWAVGGTRSKDIIQIREDRLGAPLLGMYFQDGKSITVLNSTPDGRTTKEESRSPGKPLLIDSKFHFGAVGAYFVKERPSIGYWYPGSEGERPYRGEEPDSERSIWTKRYHPIQNGLEQQYEVSFKLGHYDRFDQYYSAAWRWAWSALNPKVNYHDIDLVKRSIMNVLDNNIETHGKLTGIRNFISPIDDSKGDPHSVFGFTGKALETANYMLQYALEKNNPMSESYRKKGEAIIESLMMLDLSPPEGEGINLLTGEPVVAIWRDEKTQVYIRSFGDGLKALLKAVKREREMGIEHLEWLDWARTFADWLLPQQTPSGGFPRSWKPGTGEVINHSPHSSYNAIPFLTLLAELTGDNRYIEAAEKAGDFCWNTTHSKGIFIGGTIDNPNVLDKEAGTLSLEAYLSLFHHTADKKWLDRAVVAGNYAETWMYLWDIPIPFEEDNHDLYWKKGVSNIGLQLISVGHSGADQYMAFDVNEYADLYLSTGDEHYYQVAMILLHNTKAMLALPGREYDLKGPGWQHEHWSMAPSRGIANMPQWLPWIGTSQLNGIFELEDLSKDLYRKMISK